MKIIDGNPTEPATWARVQREIGEKIQKPAQALRATTPRGLTAGGIFNRPFWRKSTALIERAQQTKSAMLTAALKIPIAKRPANFGDVEKLLRARITYSRPRLDSTANRRLRQQELEALVLRLRNVARMMIRGLEGKTTRSASQVTQDLNVIKRDERARASQLLPDMAATGRELFQNLATVAVALAAVLILTRR